MARNRFPITWGDTGTQPPDGDDFQSGEKPDAQVFDWYWYNTIQRVDQLWDEFDRLDDNDDGVVDEADYANDADASTYKGNDIDSDGDGVVNKSDQTRRMEVRTSDPSSPDDGQMWIRSDL